MLSLAADSVSRAGRRLITVTAERFDPARAAELAADGRLAVTTAGGRVVLTGELETLRRAVGTRLSALLSNPRPVDDGDLHAPFVLPVERAHLDLSMCGVLACARASRGGLSGSTWADDAARYVLLLTGNRRDALRHAALPTSHRAFAGRDLDERSGTWPGWLSWAEMITWRGAP